MFKCKFTPTHAMFVPVAVPGSKPHHDSLPSQTIQPLLLFSHYASAPGVGTHKDWHRCCCCCCCRKRLTSISNPMCSYRTARVMKILLCRFIISPFPTANTLCHSTSMILVILLNQCGATCVRYTIASQTDDTIRGAQVVPLQPGGHPGSS